MRRFAHRLVPRSCFVLLLVLLTACGATPAAPQAAVPTAGSVAEQGAAGGGAAAGSGSLMVLEWAGYEVPEIWQPFAARHPDVGVDFSFFADNAEALTKMQSGFEADVMHPCSSYWGLFVKAGLVQPINTSRLANWPDVNPALAKEGQFDGKQYFIPWDWGYESILVRSDKISSPISSWADLWKPEYAGRIALQDSGEVNHVIAALALGLDPWNTTPEQNAQIKQKLIELRPNVLNYWSDSTSLAQQLAAGDAWVAAASWTDSYITLKNDGVAVEYLTPKEGRMGWICGFGISSKTPNLDLAYDYLDAVLAPESMAFLSNTNGYGAANKAALPLTDPELVKAMQLDQPDIIERTVFYKSVTEEQNELFNSVWAEVKAAS